MVKKYEKYKDSEIEWIGKIPKDWIIGKLGHYSTIVRGGSPRPAGDPKYFGGDFMPWITVAEVTKGNDKFLYETKKYLTEEGSKQSRIVYPETLLLSNSGATLGVPKIIKIKGCINDGSVAFIDYSPKLTRDFLYCFFITHTQIYRDEMKGSGQPNLNTDIIKSTPIPIPTRAEQIKIIEYIDYQLKLINQLITKKQKLVELLQEQRQALINEAVTKGLNPDAKMKDSGIEWLGSIPQKWQFFPLRYLGSCQNGVSQGSEYFGSGDPFVSYGDVYKNIELPLTVKGLAKSTESDKENYSVREGDVFFTRTSETVEEIGIASTCMHEIENAVFAGFLIRFRPNKDKIYKGFSKYYFRSKVPRIYFVSEMNLVTRASLSQELLKRLPICLPSITEQIEISEYLDDKCGIINKIIAESIQSINRLKEYRQSIISEAVTGKVDVRDWQPRTKATKSWQKEQKKSTLKKR